MFIKTSDLQTKYFTNRYNKLLEEELGKELYNQLVERELIKPIIESAFRKRQLIEYDIIDLLCALKGNMLLEEKWFNKSEKIILDKLATATLVILLYTDNQPLELEEILDPINYIHEYNHDICVIDRTIAKDNFMGYVALVFGKELN